VALLGVQSQGFLSWLPILENERMVFKDKAGSSGAFGIQGVLALVAICLMDLPEKVRLEIGRKAWDTLQSILP